MTDPVAGLAEMGRVTRPGGSVAACVWDHGGGSGPLSTFWRAVHDLDPSAPGEADLPGSREGHLAELCLAAGLLAPESGSLTVAVPMTGFEDWWQPFTLGVGPAGDYVAGLSPTAGLPCAPGAPSSCRPAISPRRPRRGRSEREFPAEPAHDARPHAGSRVSRWPA